MKKENKRKKRKIISIIGIIVVLILLIGTSYAVFKTKSVGEKRNKIATGTFNVEIKNEAEIELNNEAPKREKKAKEEDPYTFKVENTGTIEARYDLYIETEEETTLSSKVIRYYLTKTNKEGKETVITNNTEILEDEKISEKLYKIDIGRIKKEESYEYKLYLWVDIDASIEEASNKVFSGKVKLEAMQISADDFNDYIREGMIAWYDGIKNTRNAHEENAQMWEDLSGNENDLTISNLSFENNRVYFDSTLYPMAYTDNTVDSVITAEVVVENRINKNSNYIMAFNKNIFKMFAFASNGNSLSLGHYANRYEITSENINTLSATYYANDSTNYYDDTNASKLYINNILKEATISSQSWSKKPIHNIQIGGYADNTIDYGFNGYIYSIRLYNRELSDEERQQNHKMDINRFSINP